MSCLKSRRPWLLTALRGADRITVGEFDTIPQANSALRDQLIKQLPRIQLNPDFTGPFPLAINVAYTRSGQRGMALRQYNIHSGCEQWVSQIFTGRWAFRDVAQLRNEIEAELSSEAAAGAQL
jgi:hypothetical protein